MASNILYETIRRENRECIRDGRIIVDKSLLDVDSDSRKGISLIIPINFGKNEYKSLVRMFKVLEPDQYYYPFSDLHITIFDFIKATNEYKQDHNLEKAFVEISEMAVKHIQNLEIILNGVVVTREAGIIKGLMGII